MSTQHILVIVIPTIIIIVIVTLVRYFTRTGIFKGGKNKDSKK